MSFLQHCARLLAATLRLAAAFLRAEQRWRQQQALRDLHLPDAAALTAPEIRRFRHYYLGTTYLAVLFCTRLGRESVAHLEGVHESVTHLQGVPHFFNFLKRPRRRTEQERALFSQLAALACFFDDLVDTFRGQTELPSLSVEAYGHAADSRGLSLHFLKKLTEKLPPERLPQFRDLMRRVFRTEAAGAQRNTTIFLKTSDLEKITAEKGGCSVLLFRCLLLEPISEREQMFWRDFGLLIQLCDDIFDLWHDRRAGIATLATRFAEQNDVRGLAAFFEKKARVVTVQAGPIRGEIHFLLAITRVCLRHYAQLLEKHSSLPLDDRRLMVVDMERWGNRWRAARELLRG